MADVQASHQAYVQELKKRIAKLESVRGQAPEVLLNEARTALVQGDRSRADRLFDRIEAEDEAAVLATAEAAYQRSQIAKDEVRYRMAYEHARRAVRLAPDSRRYRPGAGELAQILGDYRTAKDDFEQALASDLRTYGEHHPAVATDRNNLGLAWKDLGKYQKAIGYFKQALDSDIKTYGEDHPAVARDCSNLGGGWRTLGKYEKVIRYLELTLAIFEDRLGSDHPSIRTVRGNLAAVRAKQDAAGGQSSP